MAGIEPVCPAWEAGALTIVLHPHTLTFYPLYFVLSRIVVTKL